MQFSHWFCYHRVRPEFGKDLVSDASTGNCIGKSQNPFSQVFSLLNASKFLLRNLSIYWWANSRHVFLLVQTRNPTLFLTAGYFRWILCKMLIQFTSGRRNSSIKQLNRCTLKVNKAIYVCNFLFWHHMMYFFLPFNRMDSELFLIKFPTWLHFDVFHVV